MTDPQHPSRILALDYGRSRIGLAIADPAAGLPSPLATLVRVNRNEDMRRLRELIREHGVKEIVVGLPLRLDGTRGDMAEEAARFAQRVQKESRLPVEMVDERLTSWQAEQLLEERHGHVLRKAVPPGREASRHSASKAKNDTGRNSVDAMAATIILSDYLEQKRAAKASKLQKDSKGEGAPLK
jgi:putative Holliday junction resolvase